MRAQRRAQQYAGSVVRICPQGERMANIVTRQCTHCHRVYLPSESPECPDCAGRVPRKLRDQINDLNKPSHAAYIMTCAKNPDVAGFQTGRSMACQKDRCKHIPQLLTLRAAAALCTLPCRTPRDCYGYLEVVFYDDLNEEQLDQIESDL